MYERVLVPVDGREPSSVALDHALEIAADHDATGYLLYVADTNKPSLVQYEGAILDVLEREGESVLSDARERAETRDVPVVDEVVQGDPRETILSATDDADLVVMGTHGRSGIEKYLLGSVTEHVVNASETPVLTVRSVETAIAYPYETILVPFDGSPHAYAALDRATEVAARHDATVHLLSIVEEPTFGAIGSSAADVEARARETLETATAETDLASVVTAVETGSVPREICAYADEEGVDLIVMGTHGRTGLDERLLGSTTERVLRTAPVPVLTTTDPGRD